MNFLAKLIAILHSDASPRQITAGLCVGLLMAGSPTLSLQGLVLLLCIIYPSQHRKFYVSVGRFLIADVAVAPHHSTLGVHFSTTQICSYFGTNFTLQLAALNLV